MAIAVIGVDFRTAPVGVREQLALSPAQALRLLHTIAAERMFAEAAVLSTCNRTEFYFVAPHREPKSLHHLLGHVAAIKGTPPVVDHTVFFHHAGEAAAEHLFRVAASLESQVVGEHEIMGQVKDAYRLACEARTAGFLVHKLMHWAFRAGKRALSETALGQGTASVSQAAVNLARQIFQTLAGKTALLVGAGQTAELAAQALVRAGVTRLIVANRTVANAQQLADRFIEWHRQEAKAAPPTLDGKPIKCPALIKLLANCQLKQYLQPPPAPPLSATAVGLDAIPQAIAQADLVISSTGAPEPVLTHASLGAVLAKGGRPLLMIDIAVPRDIDQRLGDLDNVFLYNIDGLESLVAANLERRRLEIPRAEAIVADEVRAFGDWLASLGVVPTIKLLEQRFTAVQQAQIERYQGQFPASHRQQLQEFARALCGKILHDPISFLRTANGSEGEVDLSAVSTLRQIFKLDSTEESS